MGLFDFLKGGDIASKCLKLVENGNVEKLLKLVTSGKDEDRIAALKAIAAGMKPDQDLVKAALAAIRPEESEGVREAAAAALKTIATKKECDQLLHYAEAENVEKIKNLIKEAAVEARDRTARW